MLSCSGRRGAYAPPISIQLSLCFFYDSYLVPVSPRFRFVGQCSFKFATFTIALVSKLNVRRFTPYHRSPRAPSLFPLNVLLQTSSAQPSGNHRKFVVVRAENQQPLSINRALLSRLSHYLFRSILPIVLSPTISKLERRYQVHF